MARSGHSPVRQRGTKVKTGCLTCRIRKVKCDEKQPCCQKCMSTGRKCDGYESPFRIVTSSNKDVDPPSFSPEDIAILNRYLSIKTVFNVPLGCTNEAQQILLASQTNPHLRHAISSLKALRQNFESGNEHVLRNGLQQYNMALSGLASKLSYPGSNVSSTLLCCQVFISIEQARENYAAMGQHIIQGLNIMHECRGRPAKLPFLDVFVIKLFAAPCKFAERPDSQALHRNIVPEARTALVKIAMGTLAFLGRAAQGDAKGTEKAALLKALEAWRVTVDQEAGPEPLSLSFLRFFHGILRVVLLGALGVADGANGERLLENERLQSVAIDVTQRVDAYRAFK